MFDACVVGAQAAYLNKLQMAKGTAKHVLKVTDHLLQARAALLPDYISIAKSTGRLHHTVRTFLVFCSFLAKFGINTYLGRHI